MSHFLLLLLVAEPVHESVRHTSKILIPDQELTHIIDMMISPRDTDESLQANNYVLCDEGINIFPKSILIGWVKQNRRTDSNVFHVEVKLCSNIQRSTLPSPLLCHHSYWPQTQTVHSTDMFLKAFNKSGI